MEYASLPRKIRMIFPKKERRYFLFLFFLILVSTAFDFLGVSLILPLVNLLVDPASLESHSWYRLLAAVFPLRDPNDMLLALVLLVMAVYVVKNLFQIYMTVVQRIFLARNQMNTSAKLLDRYLHKPYTFHLQHNTAEVLRSITSDVSSAYTVVTDLISLAANLLLCAVLVVYLLLVDLWLSLSIVAGLTVYSIVYFLLVRKRLKRSGEEMRRIRVRMIKALQQSVGGIKEVKVMGRERYYVEAFSSNADAFVRNRRRFSILTGIPRHLLEILCVGGVLGLIAVKIVLRQDLSAIVGGLSAFAVAAIRLMPSVNKINTILNTVAYHVPGLEAVCELIGKDGDGEEDRDGDGEDDRTDGAEAGRTEPGGAEICVDSVSFTYPGAEAPVLQDVSLTVRAGTSVGIVGATGAGKTTLVDIILGLLEPQQGSVRCGGAQIRPNDRRWQSRVGYIPQDIYLTDETIRENVALGVRREKIDDGRVWKALEEAQLADFVRGLKGGLDTVIGERGVRISGGQRQRIGIARALYHDPDILFFDEATSSLDVKTEQAVMDSVRRISGNKTCIIIAHRPSAIEGCGEVYRVEDGRLCRER